MDAALHQRFNPREYYRQFLEEGVRPDGRAVHDRRNAQLECSVIGAAHGSASVRLGQSAAVAAVRAQVSEVAPDLPTTGRIEVAVELPPLSSASFREKQRALSLSSFLSSTLGDVLNNARVFDPKQLQIREGELFWVLHVHIVCLNYDGNAFDLSMLGAVAALEDTMLPALVADSAAGLEQAARLIEAPVGASALVAEARHLHLLSRPLPTTFAHLEGHWVLDPCAAEEQFSTAVSLCLVAGRWLVYHQGGAAHTESFVGELMPLARNQLQVLSALFDSATTATAPAG